MCGVKGRGVEGWRGGGECYGRQQCVSGKTLEEFGELLKLEKFTYLCGSQESVYSWSMVAYY